MLTVPTCVNEILHILYVRGVPSVTEKCDTPLYTKYLIEY